MISRNHQLFKLVVAGALSAIPVIAVGRAHHGRTSVEKRSDALEEERDPISVASPVVVSQANRLRPHWEVQIAADPTDAKRLVACSIVLGSEDLENVETYKRPYPWNIVIYTSTDGGMNWQPTYEVDKHQHNVDPTCAFGPDGTAYLMSFGGDVYALMSWNRKEYESGRFNTIPPKVFLHMPMYRSDDHGKTWSEAGAADVADREYVTVDDTNEQYRGRVYVHGVVSVPGIDGALVNGLTILRSLDRGRTYASLKLVDEGSQYVLGNGNGIIMSDGTFATIFGDLMDAKAPFVRDPHPANPNARLKFISSGDGGETFTKSVVIGEWYMRKNGTLNDVPSLAVDRTQGSFRDRLYVAWVDTRAGRGEIRFARSLDKGRTWLPSFVASDNAAQDEKGETPDAFMPVLAVNRQGVVGLMWYDRRGHPDNLGYEVRFSASLDGGDSFLPSVSVSSGGASALGMREVLLQGPWLAAVESDGRNHAAFNWNYTDHGGDTAGLACDLAGIFHPLWIDRHSGIQQVSTTRITVHGFAARNGGNGLDNFHDLGVQAEVRYSLAHLDLQNNEIIVGAAIKNISKKPISGPIVLRLLRLSSASGSLEAVNADNGVRFSGATWGFRPLVGNSLEPGALSAARELRFKLANQPFPPASFRRSDQDLLSIDARILN